MARPWLSVLMPTFNGDAYLAQALDSVRRQQDSDVEVIAVDDGSTDETLRVLGRFTSCLNLRIIRRGRVGNWAANINHALDLAQGDYVSILHQDDVWHAERLTQLRSLVRAHPKATLFLHPSWFIDERGERLGPWRCPLPAFKSLAPPLVLERLLVQNFIAMPAPLFPRATFAQLGGMDTKLWFTPDWDLWLKLASVGPTVYCDRFLADFRLHSSSQTLTRSHDLVDFRRQHTIVLERHLSVAHAPQACAVRKAIALSLEVNTALAAAFHGVPIPLRSLLGSCLRSSPAVWSRYLRHSRLTERILARLRARFRARLSVPKILAGAAKRRSA